MGMLKQVAMFVAAVQMATTAIGQTTSPTRFPALDTAQAKDRGVALFVLGQGDTPPINAAIGFADHSTSRPMSADVPVRIASNTKTFVAAAALRLWEQGKLDLDSPIGPLLTPALRNLIERDGFRTDKITLRQLMSHSAGFYDHGSDPKYIAGVNADPSHHWTREEQVSKSVEWGDPVGGPGERFHYSDTGFILLGDIVERASGQSLPVAVRRLLKLDTLGLTSTWWEMAETPPPSAAARARQFLGNVEGTNWDGSMDLYGGGGLVMSAHDLATFFHALFGGKIFDKPSTLTEMQWKGPHRDADMYRLGLFAETVDGRTYYWHGGFWGTIVYHSPDSGLTAAIVTTDAQTFAKAKAIAGEAVGIPSGKVPALRLP